MKIAICDDEKKDRDELSEVLLSYGRNSNQEMTITEFSSGTDLLDSEDTFDLILMDYYLDESDGLKTVEMLRKRNDKTGVIFVSCAADIAFEAFRVNAFRFIVKPLNKEKLSKAVDDFTKYINNDNCLILSSKTQSWKIRYSSIIYAQSNGNKTVIHTVYGLVEIPKRMGEIQKRLPADMFIRISRSSLAGFKHISEHNDKKVIFDNNETENIGKTYFKHFKEGFLSYLKNYSFANIPERSTINQ